MTVKVDWKSHNSTEKSLHTWFLANELYKIYLANTSLRYWKFTTISENKLNTKLQKSSIINMLKKFNNGWNPELDQEWITWRRLL